MGVKKNKKRVAPVLSTGATGRYRLDIKDPEKESLYTSRKNMLSLMTRIND